MIVAVIVLGVLVLVLLGVVLWQQLRPKSADSNSALLLKQDLTKLSDDITALKDGVQKQMNDQMSASNKQIAQQSAASIKILQDVTEKITKLEGTNKNVGDIANELKTLQNVLQNPKQRGVLGEFYLEQILKNTLPPGAYQLQYKITESMIVDAAIILDDKILPLDSKFSLENYSR
jgi:DNA recombination protein RmuC